MLGLSPIRHTEASILQRSLLENLWTTSFHINVNRAMLLSVSWLSLECILRSIYTATRVCRHGQLYSCRSSHCEGRSRASTISYERREKYTARTGDRSYVDAALLGEQQIETIYHRWNCVLNCYVKPLCLASTKDHFTICSRVIAYTLYMRQDIKRQCWRLNPDPPQYGRLKSGTRRANSELNFGAWKEPVMKDSANLFHVAYSLKSDSRKTYTVESNHVISW